MSAVSIAQLAASGEQVRYAQGFQLIAVCHDKYGQCHTDEAKALAQLFAASPDLLVALQPFVMHNSANETSTITVHTADVTRARAAIAKAQGVAS